MAYLKIHTKQNLELHANFRTVDICVHIATVKHNTAQNSSDYFSF